MPDLLGRSRPVIKSATVAGEVEFNVNDTGGRELWNFGITLQVSMTAGTASVYVKGPLGLWSLWRDGATVPQMTTGECAYIPEGDWEGVKVVFSGGGVVSGQVGIRLREKAGWAL